MSGVQGVKTAGQRPCLTHLGTPTALAKLDRRQTNKKNQAFSIPLKAHAAGRHLSNEEELVAWVSSTS